MEFSTFFFMGSLVKNFKNVKLRLGKEMQGKANKWEEIHTEFRLSEAQKGSFLGETENSRWKCKMGNFSQNTTAL